ncbi:MAG: DUF935 family protein [Candidatus Marinimicrobia bacterium]|jgi:phage gp29-like protein|nr:DUF935 family protein [Candidatus Neomarinimicrobiota bacterium]MDD5539509.1 DUF935 family protein [Candidatus Neomarinimicrobiota bacterium]
MYNNPELVSKILPDTIGKVKDWNKLANYTELQYRDVRKLMSLMKRIIECDRYLFGLFQTRKLAILGFDYKIDFPTEFQKSASEEKQLEEIRLRYQTAKMRKLGDTIINGRLFGMAAVRLFWTNKTAYGTIVTKKQDYDLTELDIDFDSDGLVFIDTNKNSETFTRKKFENPEGHIFIRYNPMSGIDQYYVGSIARVNMIYCLLKYWEFWNWSKNNEKFADPLIYALYKTGSDKTQVQPILEGLAKLGTDSYAAFSDNVKINLLEAMRNSSAEAHKALIDQINTEMAISVLGQQLTTEIGKVGSFAAAKVANFVRQDYLYADLLDSQDANDQYLIADYHLNYGEPRNAYPVFTYNLDEKEDYESNARIIAELKMAGVPVKRAEVYTKTGFTEPSLEDAVI